MASIKELLSAMIAKINGKNEGVDWNENDETSPAFVKNRPFYDGIPVATEIIPETTVTFSNFNNFMIANWPENFIPTEGETYQVSWDGTEYTCVGSMIESIPYFGNPSIADTRLEDTGEPFIFMYQGHCVVGTTDTSTGEHTIGIKQPVAPINQIDKKYIPNSAFTDAEWDRISNKIVDYKQVNSSLSVTDRSIYVTPGSSDSDTINTTLIFEDGKVYRVSGTAEFTNTVSKLTHTFNIDMTSTASGYNIYLGSFYDLFYKDTAKVYLYSSSPISAGNLSITSSISGCTYTFSLDITVHGEAKVLPDLCLSDSIQRVEGDIIIPSSTADSTKKFKITVDDSGAITSTDTSDSSISYTPYSPPAVTEADAGKFLRVSSTGEWVAEKPTYTASDVGAAAESHDHNLQDLSGTVPLSKGGTGANNATDALANLGAFRFLGNDVITSIDNDTTSNWVASGSGYAFFSNNGLINDQPSQWGIVVNFVTGSDVFQMWRCQTGGPTYWRGGNASGWSGTWVKVYDTANKPALSDLDGQPTPTLSSTNIETVERTQYTYIGNMLVMSGITPLVECANNAVTSYNVWFPKTFSTACVVMASLYYNNDDPNSASKVSAVAGWYRNDTVVIKFTNTSGSSRNLRASWLAIGM